MVKTDDNVRRIRAKYESGKELTYEELDILAPWNERESIDQKKFVEERDRRFRFNNPHLFLDEKER